MASGDPTRDRPSRSTGQSRNPEASPDQATQATPSAPRDSSVQRSRYTFEDPTASNSAAAGHPTPGRSETTQQDGLLSAAAQLDIRDGAPETPPMALPLLTHLRDASLQRERGGSSGAGSPTRAASPRSVGHMTPRTQASNSPRSSGRRSGDAPAAATGGSRGPIADPKLRQLRHQLIEEVDTISLPLGPIGESALFDALLGIRAGLPAHEIADASTISELDVLRLKERLHHGGFRIPTKATTREDDLSDARAWLEYSRSVRREAQEARPSIPRSRR